MGKGCVRFKSLEDLALDVRFEGRELYGGRPRAVASWSREAGAAVLVKAGRPHRCARVRGGAHGRLPGGEGTHGRKFLLHFYFAQSAACLDLREGHFADH
jgi:hypothetical protein